MARTSMSGWPIDSGYLVLLLTLHLVCAVTYTTLGVSAIVQWYRGLWMDAHGQRRLFRRGFGR